MQTSGATSGNIARLRLHRYGAQVWSTESGKKISNIWCNILSIIAPFCIVYVMEKTNYIFQRKLTLTLNSSVEQWFRVQSLKSHFLAGTSIDQTGRPDRRRAWRHFCTGECAIAATQISILARHFLCSDGDVGWKTVYTKPETMATCYH